MDLKELGKELGSPERKREIEEKERREKMKEKTKKESGKAPKKEKNVSYVGAPYNFVSFPDQVYEYERKGCKRLPSHGELGKEKESYTGEILYRIEPVTPIFVGGGTAKPQKGDGQKQEFYKNCEGRYAIPGNSVRGLLRSNVQVLSCSSMADDIEDYSMMYRSVAGGYSSQR